MNTLTLVTERTPKIRLGEKRKYNDFWVLTSARGVQAIAHDEADVDEAIKLGKFKIDSGNGKWTSNGPSSNYTPSPHYVKLDKVQHVVESIVTEIETVY